ncbi:hypothetical protein CLIB1444_09S04962 [[Candida] jaroonii]|uniref:Uncharacterized protein n=1 Tax=[Candida] jaroonii TaxID=467808 RepID=A0ACA9YCK7_9ASCO|nr:hypothetical protein CLIB1444_09S04962 [[Candida] jaroonii]
MAPKVSHAYQTPNHDISKSRVLKSALLTVLSIFALLQLGYHCLWAFKVLYNNSYGNSINNLIFGIGTLIANAGISFKALTFLNEKLIDDGIDADHKKYL